MPEGTNSLDATLSLELLDELVLVGMECLVKMGLEVLVAGSKVAGVNGDDLGSKLEDLGTKSGAEGFSLLLRVMVADGWGGADTATPPRIAFFSSSARGGDTPSPVVVMAVSAGWEVEGDCTSSGTKEMQSS